jgi:hypothetical protein
VRNQFVVDRRWRRGVWRSLTILVCLIGIVALPRTAHSRRHVLRHLVEEDVSPAAADRARVFFQETVALAARSQCAPGCEIDARMDLLHAQSYGNTGTPALLASLDTTLRLIDSPTHAAGSSQGTGRRAPWR